MKLCPSCKTEYEELLRFCPKDGTPLVDAEMPQFFGENLGEEVTIIKHNYPKEDIDPRDVITNKPKKIAITTEEPEFMKSSSTVAQPLQERDILAIALLTAFGTIVIFSLGFISGYFFSQRNFEPVNSNASQNINVQNINTNIEITNANIKPSPTKTPTPLPSPSPKAANMDVNQSNTNVSPTPTLTVTPTVEPTPSPTNSPNIEPKPSPTSSPLLNAGVLNSRAVNLPKPVYPATAKQVGASGSVVVRVIVDEEGNVVSAKAVSGHALLRPAAEAAAIQAKFTPFVLEGKLTKASGLILYNFVLQ
jgi:TonB family protein